MTKTRLEDLCIAAIEWATEHSEDISHDLIRGMGITSDELEAIGYEKENFPSLHDAANE
jgi:hypothetical protein